MKPAMRYGWLAVAALVLVSPAGPVPAAELPGLTNPFFPFDSGVGRGKWTPAEQAQCVKDLGFDGIGYNYVREKPELLDEWQKELQQRGLKLIDLYVGIPWPKKPGERGWDYLREPIRKLKGTQTILWAPIWGRQHTDLDDAVAVKILNEIGDWCAASGIKLCLYAHLNAYTDTADDCLRLARKVNRPGVVGVSINLAHERPGGNSERLVQLPRELAPYLMLVSINGSNQRGGGILPLHEVLVVAQQLGQPRGDHARFGTVPGQRDWRCVALQRRGAGREDAEWARLHESRVARTGEARGTRG